MKRAANSSTPRLFVNENELFMSTSDGTKIQTSTYNEKQKTFTHCNYKDVEETQRESRESEHRGGLRRGVGSVGRLVFCFRSLLLCWSGSPPGPVKSPHKFIKDGNLFSI